MHPARRRGENGISYLVIGAPAGGERSEARSKRVPAAKAGIWKCGVQICDAFEKAHRAGLVHRDLKPANIMLTAAGAKAAGFWTRQTRRRGFWRAGLNQLRPAHASTPTMNLSGLAGTVGTLTSREPSSARFQYMAPETLQGKEADARSDIFSFGCVLYEMLTGRHAFAGKSQLSVASAI